MKDLTKFNKDFSERELKKLAEEKANKVEPTPTPVEILTVEADLKDFTVQDDGNENLKVSHPACQDAVIGIVSKTEYEKGNKEAILRSVIESKFAEYVNTHSLKIVGSFVEPVVKLAASERCVGCEKKFDPEVMTWHDEDALCPACEKKVSKKATQEKLIEPAKEITSDLPLLRSADSFRQNVERAAAKEQETFNRFITATVNDLVVHIKNLRYDEPKIIEAVDSSNLSLNDNGINGHLVIAASLMAETGPRCLNIPVPVTASKAVFPNESEMKELVSKSVDVQAKVIEELVKEATMGVEKVNAEVAYYDAEAEAIINEKTAELRVEATDNGIGGTQHFGPQDEITIGKHLLPVEVEVGDKLFFDGANWECICTDSEQLSKGEGDGSLLKFRKCAPPPDDGKEPKAVVPR
jgi:hypothetical protein